MEEKLFWIGVAPGALPYRVERRHSGPRSWTLKIEALFWSLEVRRSPRRRCAWIVRVPLILRLRDGAWAAVMRIKDGETDKDG